MNRAGLLAGLLAGSALLFPYLTRPGPTFSLPFLEVSAALSHDARTLIFTAQRGARAEGRLFARRGSYSGVAEFTDVFVATTGGPARCLTPRANGSSYQPALSPSGARLAFCSEASNLVADDTNSCSDIFVEEGGQLRRPALPERAGRCPSYDPAITDLPLLAFSRWEADNTRSLRLVGPGSQTRVLDLGPNQGPPYGAPSFSPQGDRLAISVFAPRVEAAGTRLHATIMGLELSGGSVSRRFPLSPGAEAPCFSPSLATHHCAFASVAQGRYQVFLRDLRQETTVQVTRGEEDSFEPSLSADGRFLAFTSYAFDANGRSDVYLYDGQTRTTKLVSHRLDGQPGNAASYRPSLSADGSTVAFLTRATDLGPEPVPEGQLYLWNRASDRLSQVTPPP